MKIVVAGGSGFIGSHVVDVLLDKGHEVLIYDLEAPHYGQKCGFIRGDTRDVDRMTQVFKSGDVVYLIAAEANVNRFFESPLFSNDITATASHELNLFQPSIAFSKTADTKLSKADCMTSS